MNTRRLWFALGSLLAIGCEAPSPDPAPARVPSSPTQVSPAVYEATGCDAQETLYRRLLVDQVRDRLEAERARYLDPQLDTGSSYSYGSPSYYPPSLPAIDASTQTTGGLLLDGGVLYGGYLGLGVFSIDSPTVTPLASLPLVGGGSPVAKAGSLLVAAGETRRDADLPRKPVEDEGPRGVYDVVDPCSLGYNCQFAVPTAASTLSLIDVNDPTSPHLRRSVTVPGRLVSAQVTGSKAQVVTQSEAVELFPSLPLEREYLDSLDPTDPAQRAEMERYFGLVADAIEAKVAATAVGGLLPWVEENGQRQPLCGTMLRSAKTRGTRTTTLLTIPLDGGPIESHAVLGSGGAVLASGGRVTVLHHHLEARRPGDRGSPVDTLFSEVFSFAVSEATPSVSRRWFAEVPGAVMGEAALHESSGALDILSSPTSAEASMVTSRPVASLPASSLWMLPASRIEAAQFEPHGHRLLVSTTEAGGSTRVQLLDPRREGSAQLLGQAATGEVTRYVRWLDASHALTLAMQLAADGLGPDRVVMQVRDLSSPSLPVTRELLVADGTTRRVLSVSLSGFDPLVRFFPDATGGWLVLPTATRVTCPTDVEREEMALFRVENDGQIQAHEPMLVSPSDCATGTPQGAPSARQVSVHDGQLAVFSRDTLTLRSLMSPTQGDRVTSLAGL